MAARPVLLLAISAAVESLFACRAHFVLQGGTLRALARAAQLAEACLALLLVLDLLLDSLLVLVPLLWRVVVP